MHYKIYMCSQNSSVQDASHLINIGSKIYVKNIPKILPQIKYQHYYRIVQIVFQDISKALCISPFAFYHKSAPSLIKTGAHAKVMQFPQFSRFIQVAGIGFT